MNTSTNNMNNSQQNVLDTTVFWVDDKPVSSNNLVNVVRKLGGLPDIVREIILDEALKDIIIEESDQLEALSEFRSLHNLENDEKYLDYLKNSLMDEKILTETTSRPLKIVKFREERWGPRASSLYLKHKESYDLVTYRCLMSINSDVMQEIYFRLKDKEETWESLAEKFPGGRPGDNAQVSSVPVRRVDTNLLNALRAAGEGKLIKPILLKDRNTAVAELELFKASRFDNEIRALILRQEFDEWLKEESIKMLTKLRFSK